MGEVLLTPTRIYVKSCLAAVAGDGVKGLAHITGGGLVENIPRVLPHGLRAVLDANTWPLPPLFSWLAAQGNMASNEMARTFNCGIGMTVITAPDAADRITNILTKAGETVYPIGIIEPAPGDDQDTVIEAAETAWQS